MKVLLVRHGKTKDDSLNIIQSKDSILDEKLIPELRRTREQLDLEGRYKLLCSPYVRTRQTASFLFPEENIEIVPYAHEVMGASELIGKAIIQNHLYWDRIPLTSRYDINWKPEGGESFSDVLSRVNKLFDLFYKESAKYDTIALVTHGNLMRHIIGKITYQEEYTPKHFIHELRPKLEIHPGQIIKLNVEHTTITLIDPALT